MRAQLIAVERVVSIIRTRPGLGATTLVLCLRHNVRSAMLEKPEGMLRHGRVRYSGRCPDRLPRASRGMAAAFARSETE
jgi:hypothetical protein